MTAGRADSVRHDWVRRLAERYWSTPDPDSKDAMIYEFGNQMEEWFGHYWADVDDIPQADELSRLFRELRATRAATEPLPTRVWTAYADGAPAAALGGRGVSTPPNQVLAHARETPDLSATARQDVAHTLGVVHTSGLDR